MRYSSDEITFFLVTDTANNKKFVVTNISSKFDDIINAIATHKDKLISSLTSVMSDGDLLHYNFGEHTPQLHNYSFEHFCRYGSGSLVHEVYGASSSVEEAILALELKTYLDLYITMERQNFYSKSELIEKYNEDENAYVDSLSVEYFVDKYILPYSPYPFTLEVIDVHTD